MPNGDFEPMYSTNNIWYDTYTAQCLTNHLEDMEADIDTLQTGKANVNHTHNEYSPINHEHSEYALVNHSHTGYALIGHTHSYNDLEDKPVIPTTLPANGGNSDTVDGKHAADFATVESVDMLQTLVGSTSVQSQISTAVGTITPTSIGAAEEDHVHNYNDLTNKPTSLPANGGNADTVDGKHANDFATAESMSAMETLVGSTSVQSQISNAIDNHTHSYNNLTDKPTSLPANGGNADTVDGKHASDFATSADITTLQNLVGDTAVPTQINNAITSAASDLSDTYATKANPKFENSISMNRETWSTVGTNSIAIGNYCQASGNYSYAEGYFSKATTSESVTPTSSNSSDLGYCCHAEGYFSVARGAISHAEGNGTLASGGNSHSEGCSTTASGECSHAEGYHTTASGKNAHAEGISTKATGDYTHAEGYYSEATKNYAHAEGCQTVASGTSSHAEGANTIASGYHSHAEGDETIAQTLSQHVEGAYNIPDSGGSVSRYGKYLHIAGNGSNLARSNAYTLDWDGNGWFAGTIEGTAMILKSSTPNSTKRFKITVDDSGAISTTEIN